MKLTLDGTPEEIAAFLDGRAFSLHEVVAMPPFPPLSIDDLPDPPDPNQVKEKPPAQTIAPAAIEKLEFGLDSAGSPVDVAVVHRKIGELLRSQSFQQQAAQHMPSLDAFEPPMMHAKRYLMACCVRDNLFNLGALDAMCVLHISPSTSIPGDIVTFEGE